MKRGSSLIEVCDLHFKNQSKSEVGPDPLNEKKYDAINNQYLIEKKTSKHHSQSLVVFSGYSWAI